MLVYYISIDIDDLDKIKDIHHYLDNINTNIIKNKAIFFINSKHIRYLNKSKIHYTLIKEDVCKFYRNRILNSKYIIDKTINITGSMGNFMTFNEIENKIKFLQKTFPRFITKKFSIGQTIENRNIWAINVSNGNNNNPEILITGLLEAREVISYTSILYYIEWLCINYDNNDTAKYILDTKQLWFIPCLNPDGLAYNEKIENNGGGMYNKNRNVNCDNKDLIGINLNRNFPIDWNLDNIGSSNDCNSSNFKGARNLSERETWALSLFIKTRNFILHINFEAFGNQLLVPNNKFLNITKYATKNLNNFTYGSICDLEIVKNGTITKWFNTKTNIKDKINSFKLKLGTYDDGYWPISKNIIPICENAVNITNNLCQLCDDYYFLDCVIKNSKILLNIKNISIFPKDISLTVKIEYNNTFINLSHNEWEITLDNDKTKTIEINYFIINKYFIKTNLIVNLIKNNNTIKSTNIKIKGPEYLNETGKLTKEDLFLLFDYQDDTDISNFKCSDYDLQQSLRLFFDIEDINILKTIFKKKNTNKKIINNNYIKNVINKIYE